MKQTHYWIGFSLAMGEWSLLDFIAGEERLANGMFVAFYALAVAIMWQSLRKENDEG